MFSLANLLARNTWFIVIQWMRRPWMRKIHLMPMRRMNELRKEKFYEGYKSQNRIARRIGLPLLKYAFLIFLASLFLQLTYYAVLMMNEHGWLAPPELEKHRIMDVSD